jgi:hypothetical protein
VSPQEEAASLYGNAQRLRRIAHRHIGLLGLELSGNLRALAEAMDTLADALILPPLRR